ncbi:hypothetical protein L596_002771 [Steinernema carpocapsae]|uniref:Splicing factor 3A subunit 1 n=1 Tax=Steinernema carpocapsae TaxID=34508 RepID=A0A4U8UT41_STECR|nr:hypothetical protein L596_002771 [Steinernema carpocapsae]
MAPIVVSNREEDLLNNEPSMTGRTPDNVICPPPDIRTIVDKTATFVARNGLDFETKIREKEAGNPRFSFLNPSDPYNAYYRNKVQLLQNGANDAAPAPGVPAIPQLPRAVIEHFRQAEFVPDKPPVPFEFCAEPSSVNAFDLDLIKLTALFVARNGRQFLTQLMNREMRNYQFDFLKPQHSNFGYFSKLVEQYSKIILTSQTLIEELKGSRDSDKLLSDIRYRVGWEKHQKMVKDRQEQEQERERLAYSQIDWHDFVVVQTVDFLPTETGALPPLCSRKDVGARILMQAHQEAAKAAQQSVAMDMDSDSDDEPERPAFRSDDGRPGERIRNEQRSAYEVTQPMPAAPTANTVVIKDYDPKRDRAGPPKTSDKWLISPLTDERIAADKLQEHVRYNTVTTQYKEQREREQLERADEEPVYAQGGEIGRNISRLAERRTDIFGVGAQGGEQNVIGKKLGEVDSGRRPQDTRMIWDGQASTIDATTRAAQQSVSLDQQISEIHKQHGYDRGIPFPMPPPLPMPVAPQNKPPPPQMFEGMMSGAFGGGPLLPRPSMAVPLNQVAPHMNMMNMPPAPFASDEGPSSKRMRLETDLEPEQAWIAKVNGTITVQVHTPASSEWKLSGNAIYITIGVTEKVSELKKRIEDQVEVPVSKIKLVSDGLFLKDNMSLAFYNMYNQSVVQLKLKERGGRK